MIDQPDLPFSAYPQLGRALLGKPRWGDGTARRSYGVKALEWCGYRCAYCGLDMSTFEGWLQLCATEQTWFYEHICQRASEDGGN